MAGTIPKSATKVLLFLIYANKFAFFYKKSAFFYNLAKPSRGPPSSRTI